MEYPLDVAQPWRTRAFVAAGVAALELVLVLTLGIVLVSRSLSHDVTRQAEATALAPAKPTPKPKPASYGQPTLARAQTSVLVLNGNGVSGAAAAAAARVRARGYIVGGVGNAPHQGVAHSVVMFRPGYAPEAQRLAKDLGIPIVSPLDGLRESDLMGAHIALVVGSAS